MKRSARPTFLAIVLAAVAAFAVACTPAGAGATIPPAASTAPAAPAQYAPSAAPAQYAPPAAPSGLGKGGYGY